MVHAGRRRASASAGTKQRQRQGSGGSSVIGIQLDGLAEFGNRQNVVFARIPQDALPAPLERLARVDVASLSPPDFLFFVLRQLQRQRIDNHPDESVLNREDVVETTVVALGPELAARQRVDELDVDADGVSGPTYAAVHHVTHAKALRNIAHFGVTSLKLKYRISGDDEQPGNLGEISDQIVGQPIDEVILLRPAAHVLK